MALKPGAVNTFAQVYCPGDVPSYPSFNYRIFFTPCLNTSLISEHNYMMIIKNKTYGHLEEKEVPTEEMLLNSEYEFDFEYQIDHLNVGHGFTIFNNEYPKTFTTREPWNDWYHIINILDDIFMCKFNFYYNGRRKIDLNYKDLIFNEKGEII